MLTGAASIGVVPAVHSPALVATTTERMPFRPTIFQCRALENERGVGGAGGSPRVLLGFDFISVAKGMRSAAVGRRDGGSLWAMPQERSKRVENPVGLKNRQGKGSFAHIHFRKAEMARPQNLQRRIEKRQDQKPNPPPRG